MNHNTDEAIAAGVFGVPTFGCDGQVFRGDDATDMLPEFPAQPEPFESAEMTRISTMPMGLVRRRE